MELVWSRRGRRGREEWVNSSGRGVWYEGRWVGLWVKGCKVVREGRW